MVPFRAAFLFGFAFTLVRGSATKALLVDVVRGARVRHERGQYRFTDKLGSCAIGEAETCICAYPPKTCFVKKRDGKCTCADPNFFTAPCVPGGQNSNITVVQNCQRPARCRWRCRLCHNLEFCIECEVGWIVSFGRCVRKPKREEDEWVKLHNIQRCIHGVGPVLWSKSLAKAAAKYADDLVVRADKCLVHDKVKGMGENLALNLDIATSMQVYYDEIRLCGESWPGCSADGSAIDGAGHFTAIVWKTLGSIGCARRSIPGHEVHVCRFWTLRGTQGPNLHKHYEENIFPPERTIDECIDREEMAFHPAWHVFFDAALISCCVFLCGCCLLGLCCCFGRHDVLVDSVCEGIAAAAAGTISSPDDSSCDRRSDAVDGAEAALASPRDVWVHLEEPATPRLEIEEHTHGDADMGVSLREQWQSGTRRIFESFTRVFTWAT